MSALQSQLADQMARALAEAGRARLEATGQEGEAAWFRVSADGWFSAAACLLQQGWIRLVDLTVIDWLHAEGEAHAGRFELVLRLGRIEAPDGVILRTRLPGELLSVSSVGTLWPGALWLEREAFDLYGVRFFGNPDLRRILLYPAFVGHPLRKDYEKHHRQPLLRVGPLARLRGGP